LKISPSQNKFYEVLQQRWDDEFSPIRKSYWGTDYHAYRLLCKTREVAVEASWARQAGNFNKKIFMLLGMGLLICMRLIILRNLSRII